MILSKRIRGGSSPPAPVMTKDIEKVRAASRKWYYNNKQQAISNTRRRIKDLKFWWQDYKSDLTCSKCPENHPACIEFHHRSNNKEMSLSNAIKNGWSKDKILEEVAKCDVLCANCHRKEHWSIESGRLVFKKSD